MVIQRSHGPLGSLKSGELWQNVPQDEKQGDVQADAWFAWAADAAGG